MSQVFMTSQDQVHELGLHDNNGLEGRVRIELSLYETKTVNYMNRYWMSKMLLRVGRERFA